MAERPLLELTDGLESWAGAAYREGEEIRARLETTLRGSYEPPLGGLGRARDRTLFHRVAKASVKRFLDRIARGIQNDGETTAHIRNGRDSGTGEKRSVPDIHRERKR